MQFVFKNNEDALFDFIWYSYSREPPKTKRKQQKAANKDEQADDIGLTTQINERKRVVDDVDNHAQNNAARAPVEPP